MGIDSRRDVVANPIAVQIAPSPATVATAPTVLAPAPGHNLSRLTTAFFVGLMLLAGVYLVLVRSATNPARRPVQRDCRASHRLPWQ